MSSPYAPIYAALDPAIELWAHRHGFVIHHYYLGKESRGAHLTDRFGNAYNILILPPIPEGIPVRAFSDGHRLLLHSGRIRKPQYEATEFYKVSSQEALVATLDDAHAHLMEVMAKVEGKLA